MQSIISFYYNNFPILHFTQVWVINVILIKPHQTHTRKCSQYNMENEPTWMQSIISFYYNNFPILHFTQVWVINVILIKPHKHKLGNVVNIIWKINLDFY